MKKLALTFALVLGAGLASACGSVCDSAADVAQDVCGIEPVEGGTDDGMEVECTGAVEKGAQCIVDNEDAYCAFLQDPVANNDNAYTQCAASAGG